MLAWPLPGGAIARLLTVYLRPLRERACVLARQQREFVLQQSAMGGRTCVARGEDERTDADGMAKGHAFVKCKNLT